MCLNMYINLCLGAYVPLTLDGNIIVDHPAGTSVGSVRYDKPVHSASHCGQWVTFFWHVVRQILWKIRGYHNHL